MKHEYGEVLPQCKYQHEKYGNVRIRPVSRMQHELGISTSYLSDGSAIFKYPNGRVVEADDRPRTGAHHLGGLRAIITLLADSLNQGQPLCDSTAATCKAAFKPLLGKGRILQPFAFSVLPDGAKRLGDRGAAKWTQEATMEDYEVFSSSFEA